jgi:hypothetical protein
MVVLGPYVTNISFFTAACIPHMPDYLGTCSSNSKSLPTYCAVYSISYKMQFTFNYNCLNTGNFLNTKGAKKVLTIIVPNLFLRDGLLMHPSFNSRKLNIAQVPRSCIATIIHAKYFAQQIGNFSISGSNTEGCAICLGVAKRSNCLWMLLPRPSRNVF